VCWFALVLPSVAPCFCLGCRGGCSGVSSLVSVLSWRCPVSALLSLLTVLCCLAFGSVVCGVAFGLLPLFVGVVYSVCLAGALVALWAA
jgi:hypothetical protein